jgi:hypothetical protein
MKIKAGELPMVLTATIVPNLTGGVAENPKRRLEEYRQVTTFCLQHGPVIFLENSGYPLEQHPEWQATDRFSIHRFERSKFPERGKGYQEFEMLDAWIRSEKSPPARWLKISGRYQVINLDAILNECRQEEKNSLIIDQLGRSRQARTYLFCTSTEFYQERILGCYRKCDDRSGDWIERVLYRELEKETRKPLRIFKTQPRLHAVAGSSGNAFSNGKMTWLAKQTLRRLNRLVDERHLWYAN